MGNKIRVSKYTVKAPAKVNIGLRVLSRRKDGYHNLETIFYPVNLFDTLKLDITMLPITVKKNIVKVSTQPKIGITGNKNICYRAAVMFFEKFGIKEKYRVNISIKKNIPTGAGLGGGSSDAAAVLRILVKHFRHNENKLSRCAQDIGSDVPFFLLGKPAYALGKGEKLSSLPNFKIKGRVLLINPGIHISTPWAFKELKIKNRKSKLMSSVQKFGSGDERLMINDFERIVFKKYPVIEKIKYDMLKLGAEYSLMSGSGSTVYGIFRSNNIKQAEKYFKEKKFKVFVS